MPGLIFVVGWILVSAFSYGFHIVRFVRQHITLLLIYGSYRLHSIRYKCV